MKLPKETILVELWAIHNIMLGLGFNADDVYVSPEVLNPDMEPCLGVVLRTQGIEFSAFIGTPDDGTTHMHFLRHVWPPYVAEKKKLSNEAAEKLWHATQVWYHKADMMTAMLVKGLKFPYTQKGANGAAT